MADRANVFTIHSWDNADDCRRMEELLRECDPDLAHYSLPPERAVPGTTEEVAASIRSRIEFATAVVVLNTPGLHNRATSDFEMRTAVNLGKRIVVVQPHGEFQQPVPAVLDGQVYRYATWRSDVVGRAIRGEYPQDGRVFDLAEVADRRDVVGILAGGVAAVSIAVIVNTAGSLQNLQRELGAAGIDVRWNAKDTSKLLGHVVTGALIVGGIAAAFTGDFKTALYAAGAGGAAGAAIAVHRAYEARLIGASRVRVLAIAPVGRLLQG